MRREKQSLLVDGIGLAGLVLFSAVLLQTYGHQLTVKYLELSGSQPVIILGASILIAGAAWFLFFPKTDIMDQG